MAYPGGKGGAGVYQTIINLIPPHKIYIEPFLGGGAIFKNKLPAQKQIVIDVNNACIKASRDLPIKSVKRINDCGIDFLEAYHPTGKEFIYCDPPYVRSSTKTRRDMYNCDFNDGEHVRLIDALKALDCHIMISGYPNKLYDDNLKGWHTETYQSMTRGGSMATECLWMNYPTPKQLHDYRHLGNNFRERDRLRKMQGRWRNRLQKMPELQMKALLSVMKEFYLI